jgi:hypothetical protein
MKKLFLDDIRQVRDACYYVINPKIYWEEEDWDIVRNYDEFIKYIEENGLPDLISFDHDLADEHYNDLFSDKNWFKDNDNIELVYDEYKEKTGLECAKWLVDFCLDNNKKLPDYIVHSANPIGKKNIESFLNNARKMLKL